MKSQSRGQLAPYLQIPYQLLTKLTVHQTLVLSFILSYDNQKKVCFATNAYMAKKLGMGESTVKTTNRFLEDKGLINNIKEPNRRKLSPRIENIETFMSQPEVSPTTTAKVKTTSTTKATKQPTQAPSELSDTKPFKTASLKELSAVKGLAGDWDILGDDDGDITMGSELPLIISTDSVDNTCDKEQTPAELLSYLKTLRNIYTFNKQSNDLFNKLIENRSIKTVRELASKLDDYFGPI